MKLLIVEDEPNLLSVLRQGFTEKGHEVSAALDGRTALQILESGEFDAIILDLMLPDIGGMEICRNLRESGNFTPVLMLTALNSTDNVVAGLNAGADDYVPKPFRFLELEARVSALVRRSGVEQRTPDTVIIGDMDIDMRAKKVKRQNQAIALTAKEFRLLAYLAKNKGVVLSREQILERVWDINFDMNTNVVDVYINYLRKKIDKPFGERLIHTVKGLGYKLTDAD